MRRAFLLVALYALAGTALTLLIYRIILGGPFYGVMDRTIDGLVIFISITFNSLLGFAAAGVAAAMVSAAAPGLAVVVGVSAVVAGVVALMMTLWFSGLNWMFPLTVIGVAAICAVAAHFAGLLRHEAPPTQP
jgi:hypothetical protein